MYSYLTDKGHVDKGVKGTKKCAIKWSITFEEFKICLENTRTILKTQQRFRIKTHNVFTMNSNKIALSANGDKRMQTANGVTTYPYVYGAE